MEQQDSFYNEDDFEEINNSSINLSVADPAISEFLTKHIKEIEVIRSEKWDKRQKDRKSKIKSEADWTKEIVTAEALIKGLNDLKPQLNNDNFYEKIDELINSIRDNKESYTLEKNNKSTFHRPNSRLLKFVLTLKEEAQALNKRLVPSNATVYEFPFEEEDSTSFQWANTTYRSEDEEGGDEKNPSEEDGSKKKCFIM